MWFWPVAVAPQQTAKLSLYIKETQREDVEWIKMAPDGDK
jgi:hypothetical protein